VDEILDGHSEVAIAGVIAGTVDSLDCVGSVSLSVLKVGLESGESEETLEHRHGLKGS